MLGESFFEISSLLNGHRRPRPSYICISSRQTLADDGAGFTSRIGQGMLKEVRKSLLTGSTA